MTATRLFAQRTRSKQDEGYGYAAGRPSQAVQPTCHEALLAYERLPWWRL